MPIPGVTIEDVDAYSDVSNGSTISVGSAASGGSGHMPRPPSGSSKRSKSVQGRRSRVAKSPYSNSQLKSSSKQQLPKPAARNMWITAMRNGTATLSTENSPLKTWGGSRASQNKQNKTGTRSRHLSDYVQIEDLKSKNHVRSASMSASEPQLSIGGPAYKPQEDYYDEIIELKKIINALKAENNILNTKLRRVEGENVLKDRKMEDLLNTRKQPEDVRRTLTDKKGDTSAIVNSLKQKLHAVERTVKDKEAELSQLKKDIKMTNIEELQIQSETYYQEVQRLQLALIEMQQSQLNGSFGTMSPRNSPLSKGTKGFKPSNVSLQRLAEENEHLKADNRALKKDLLTAIENASTSDKKTTLRAEYADMNRGQLLARIHELEEKVQDANGKKTQTRKGSLPEEKENVEDRRKSISKATVEVLGRLELKGTTSQKLAQLQEREVELLEEKEKQREIIQRLKEDRAHYREVADDLRVQLKSTQEELDRLGEEKGIVGDRRSSTSSVRRKSSVKEVPPQDDNDEEMDRMLQDFQQQRAAKALQRQWRGYQGRKKTEREERDRQAVERQNQAAATLQKNWRKHRDKTKQMDEEAKQEAITQIQAALRGQAARNKYIAQLDKELEFTDRDDAVVALQSAMRAHLARKKHLGHIEEDELTSRDTRTRGSSSRNFGDSEPDSDEGLVTRSSSTKRHPEPATTGLRRSSLTVKLAPVKIFSPARDNALAPSGLSTDQAHVTSALANNPTESDSDDDAVVIGRSAKNKKETQNKEITSDQLNSETFEERNEKELKKPREMKEAKKESVKREVEEEKSLIDEEEGSRRSLITAPRFANISENSEEDDAVVTSPSRSNSIQKRSSEHLNDSELEDVRQKPMKKTFEIVDSDDEDDEDEVIVSHPRRSLDTGFSQQRSPLRQSGRPLNSSTSSQREVLESSRDETSLRSGLSISKRLLSGKKLSLDRSGDGDGREAKNSQILNSKNSSAPMGSEGDSDEDDDDDDAVVSRPSRSLDAGFSQQRPSLRQSSRPLSSSTSSPREVLDSNKVETPKRPGLSQSKRPLSGKRPSVDQSGGGNSREARNFQASSSRRSSLPVGSEEDSDDDDAVVSRSSGPQNASFNQQRPSTQRSGRTISSAASNLREVLDSSKEEAPQRLGLSLSKRPLSGKKPSLDRSGSGDSGEARNSRAASGRKSSLLVGSEEESDDDDVIVTGRKTKAPGSDKKPARPSPTRKSSASSTPQKRGSIVSSLDNFFSSTASSKDSYGKKSPRKTLGQLNESDDDDDDDDEDEIVMSSLSGSKFKQKRRASTDSVANLWATSDSGNDSKTKRKLSLKSSPSNKWNADFEFEKPSHRRPDSQLDELF